MVRLRPKHFFKYLSSSQWLGIGFVGRQDCDSFIQRESVDDCGLLIVRIPEINLFHRLFICEDPRPMIALVPVLIVGFHSCDIVPLALRLSA